MMMIYNNAGYSIFQGISRHNSQLRQKSEGYDFI